MPIKPNPIRLSADSSKILNAIRNESGSFYQSLVPLADGTSETMRSIGTAIIGNVDIQNQFLNSLINRIGRVIMSTKQYTNPWAFFKKGKLEYGETIEEIFVSIAEPHTFNPQVAENEVFKREIPNVLSEFHTLNYRTFYKTTIQETDLKQAFLSSEGVTDLITKIIDNMYTASEYDEFIMMKYLVGRMALDSKIKKIDIPTVNKSNIEDVVTSIKRISDDMTFMRNDYTIANVLTKCDKNEQYLLMSTNFNAINDVSLLSSAFNMDKAEFMGHKTLFDNFALNAIELSRLKVLLNQDIPPYTTEELELLQTINLVLVDKEWFMIFDNSDQMTDTQNGQGLYWNYWYHVWKTFSVSPFANACMFTSSTSAITKVELSPSTASVKKGQSLQLVCNVTGTGFVNQGVEYSLPSNVANGTTITSSGLLFVAQNETQTSIVVTATSKEDGTKKGISTITVTE